MHTKQLMILVHAFALTQHAYVSVDKETGCVYIYENNKVIFHPSKIIISHVPYTDGAFYVCLNTADVYFPPAFTPREMIKHLKTAWDLNCIPKETQKTRFLEPGYLSSDAICP